jgi:predicted transposase YdaD
MFVVEFNRFDVATKELVWDDPAACLERFGIGPPGPVEVIDSDITAVTAGADKVIKVGGPEPYLVNLELQSSHDKELIETTWFRQAALYRRHKLPVLTVLVLLRRQANSPSFTGSFEIRMRDGWQTNQYNYRVVRLWQEEPDPYLTAGVNLVPLAPLTNVVEDELPELVRRMDERISAEPRPKALKLWTATYLLMGLCYSEELVAHLLEGVADMQESTTYQAILREGRDEGLVEGRNEGRFSEARRLLILLGEARFGAPSEAIRTAVEAIQDLERLETMSRRTLDTDIHDWEGLLGAS